MSVEEMRVFQAMRKITVFLATTALLGVTHVNPIHARAEDDVCGFGYVHYDDDYNADYEDEYSFLDDGYCEKIEWEYSRIKDAFRDWSYLSIQADELFYDDIFTNVTELTFVCSREDGLEGWISSDPIGLFPSSRGTIKYRIDRGPIKTTTYTRSSDLEDAILDNPKALSRALISSKKYVAIQVDGRVATFPRSNLNSVRKKFSGNCRLG